MDEDVFEIAKEHDLSIDEAEELQDFIDDTGLDPQEAYDIWREL